MREDYPASLRLADVSTFLTVHRCGSITGAARELHVTPSQVSKAVARLERTLRVTLLSRSVRGTVLSDAALRVLPDLEQTMASVRRAYRNETEAGQRVITVAAPSYLCTSFLPVVAATLPQLRLRALELPPAVVRAHSTDNFFDVCLVPGTPRLPSTWQSVAVGTLRKGLFARPELARRLGSPTPVERLAQVPFLSPVYMVNGQFAPVDDDCPLHFTRRRLGCEVQTIITALEVAMLRDEVVFGPVIAAWRHLENGWLVEVPVEGWAVTETLYFAWSEDRVRMSEQRAIASALAEAAQQLEGASTEKRRVKRAAT